MTAVDVRDEAGLRAAIKKTDVGLIRIHGAIPLQRQIVVDRAVSIECQSPLDYLSYGIPEVTAGESPEITRRRNALREQTLVVFRPQEARALAGIRGITARLNVLGGFAPRFVGCCERAVTFDRVDNSDLAVSVFLGTLQEAVAINGSLNNRLHLVSSVNDAPRLGTVPEDPLRFFQTRHLRIGTFEVTKPEQEVIVSNANDIRVVIEGGSTGITTADLRSEGNNTISGTIEGLAGDRPVAFRLRHCRGAVLRDLHIESRKGAPHPITSIIEDSENIRVEGLSSATGELLIRRSHLVTVDNCSSGVLIDATYMASASAPNDLNPVAPGQRSSAILLRGIAMADTVRGTIEPDPATNPPEKHENRYVDIYDVAEAVDGSAVLSGGINRIRHGLSGGNGPRNLFPNPYLVWSPDDVTLPTGISHGDDTEWIRPNSTPANWTGNPVERRSTVVKFRDPAGRASLFGPRLLLDSPDDRFLVGSWVSFLVPVLLASLAKVPVVLFPLFGNQLDRAPFPVANSFQLPKGRWALLRGSVRMPPDGGYADDKGMVRFGLELRQVSDVATNTAPVWDFEIGGCSIVAGSIAPKGL